MGEWDSARPSNLSCWHAEHLPCRSGSSQVRLRGTGGCQSLRPGSADAPTSLSSLCQQHTILYLCDNDKRLLEWAVAGPQHTEHCVLSTCSQSTGICCLLADGKPIRRGQGLTSWATECPMASPWLSQAWRQHLGPAQVSTRSSQQLGCRQRQMVVWQTWRGTQRCCSSRARPQQVGSCRLGVALY